MNSITQYSVNAVKTFKGHDGYGYSCNLLRDNKKIAEVVEDGWGGGLQFHWVDHTTKAVVNSRDYAGEPHSFNGTVEQAAFYEAVMQLPKIPGFDNESDMFTNPDIVVDDMVNDFLLSKKIKSDLKKNFTIKSQDGQLLTWKISPVHTMEVLKQHALKKYPQSLIVNELSISDVVKVYKEANLVA